jgi:tRNA modification GTPase
MVSEIAGTTRDRIEERINIGGVGFRFIDTAGLRATDDVLERMGIDRALEAVAKARIVLLVVDAATTSTADVSAQIAELGLRSNQRLCVVINKIDSINNYQLSTLNYQLIALSAKTGENLDVLTAWLSGVVDVSALEAGSAVVSSARHYGALTRAREAVGRVSDGLSSGISPDLLAGDVREVLHHLGEITGEITTDEILGTIFSKFCIGK